MSHKCDFMQLGNKNSKYNTKSWANSDTFCNHNDVTVTQVFWTVNDQDRRSKESQTCINKYLQRLCYVNQLYHLITLMTSQQDGRLHGCAASPKSSLPEISFTPPPFPKRTQKSGEKVEVTTAAKMLEEDRRRGIAVGWWVRICQKAEMSVPSTAETAFLILSVTH